MSRGCDVVGLRYATMTYLQMTSLPLDTLSDETVVAPVFEVVSRESHAVCAAGMLNTGFAVSNVQYKQSPNNSSNVSDFALPPTLLSPPWGFGEVSESRCFDWLTFTTSDHGNASTLNISHLQDGLRSFFLTGST